MVDKDEYYEPRRANVLNPNGTPTTKDTGRINSTEGLTKDPWSELRQFTSARIALGRVGSSLPTKEILDFGVAHALARDAVHKSLDANAFSTRIRDKKFDCLIVKSQAKDRASFLLRPDLGRRLDDMDKKNLQKYKAKAPIDLLLVIGDGLSTLAVESHALALIEKIREALPKSLKLGPIVLATQARVALADDIADTLDAAIVAMLIGERPGLNSPDSLGVYLTYKPKLDCTDADRNCISNIRPQGLSYALAVEKLLWLIRESIRIKATGISLKDQSDLRQLKRE